MSSYTDGDLYVAPVFSDYCTKTVLQQTVTTRKIKKHIRAVSLSSFVILALAVRAPRLRGEK